MVTITSTGLSVEDAKDAAGETANNGLAYDDVTNELDVDPGPALQIDGNGRVDIVDNEIQDTVGSSANDGLTYDSGTNNLNVVAGNALTIDGSSQVAVVDDEIEKLALAYDFVGGG